MLEKFSAFRCIGELWVVGGADHQYLVSRLEMLLDLLGQILLEFLALSREMFLLFEVFLSEEMLGFLEVNHCRLELSGNPEDFVHYSGDALLVLEYVCDIEGGYIKQYRASFCEDSLKKDRFAVSFGAVEKDSFRA